MYKIFGDDIDIDISNNYASFLRKSPQCGVYYEGKSYSSCAESTLLSLLVNIFNHDDTYIKLDTEKIQNFIPEIPYSMRIKSFLLENSKILLLRSSDKNAENLRY